MLGYDASDLLGQSMPSHLDTEVLWRRNGTPLEVEFMANPLVEDGRTIGVVVAFQDISERKDAERRLSESEERLRLAVEIAGLGTWDWDLRDNTVVWSPVMERMLGLEPGAFGGTIEAFRALVHHEDQELLKQHLQQTLECGVPYRPELRMLAADGTTRWLSVMADVYRDAHGQPARMVGVARDTTDAKNAERQHGALQRSEKLLALGQMASGVAHDLNQSLMLVAGYGDLARDALDREPLNRAELRGVLEAVSQAAVDGGETIRRLLRFSANTPDADGRRPLDLARIVSDAVSLTAPRWRNAAKAEGHAIKVAVHQESQPVIMGSASDLRDALVNLLFNAFDALPVGGTVHVRVSSDATHATLEVKDSGIGMSAEVQARMFEPFYTTKGERGTGLGLAQVCGIVEQHAGELHVESAPGCGTTIRIKLPLSMQSRSNIGPVASNASKGAGLKILVVEDEAALLTAVVRMLRPSGYVVQTASTGEAALELLAQDRYDAVVCDLGLGSGINGWDVAAAVRRHWPDVRFILATGWGSSIDETEALHRGVDRVLPKPYRLEDLCLALDAPAARRVRLAA